MVFNTSHSEKITADNDIMGMLRIQRLIYRVNEGVHTEGARSQHSLLITLHQDYPGQERPMKNVILPGFAALLLLTSWKVLCFNPNFGDSVTHSDITKEAALRIVLQLFRQVPNPDGKVLPSNIFQPRGQKFTAEELFEAYYGSKVSVSRFKQAVQVMMNRNTKVDFQYALEGKRHFDSETLQEGKEVLLSKTEQTCADCFASTGCQDEILDKVIKEKIITTGYFGFKPHSKPD
ncbi:hypothetical protein scyTo_0016525, partial [Scyliorhinus torazame]|nr:hypothetical protein [Scyliorhinus torazame]